MSCPDRTLVTKVPGHPSGNQCKPTRGGSGSFQCGSGVRPRPAALRVPPRFASGVSPSHLSLAPGVFFRGPPFISTRDLMFSSSFPQVCPHPPGVSHVPFSPPVPPGPLRGSSATLSRASPPMPPLLCRGQGYSFIRPPARTEAVIVSDCVRPSVNVGLRLSGAVTACDCPSARLSPRLLFVCHCGCLLRRCGSFGRVTMYLSVCRRLSLESVRAPGVSGSRLRGRGREGRWQPGEAGRGGGGDSGRGRGRAGAPCGPEGVCAGGRRRRLSESAQPAPGNIGRLQLPARPGPARPPQVSLPPRPGPSPGPRPIPRPGKCALPEGSGPPKGTPTAPPGLPSDAPRRPTLILNSSLAAAYLLSPAREPAPCRAGRRLCSRIPVGTPERPFPRPPPSVGPLEDAPCLGRNPSCAGCWHRVDSPPRSRNPSAPAQRPAEAPSEAQASPSHGDSVSILGKGEAQRKPRVIISPTPVS